MTFPRLRDLLYCEIVRWQLFDGEFTHVEAGQAATPAGIGKHPIHPMRVGIPIGLWVLRWPVTWGGFNRNGDLEPRGLYSTARSGWSHYGGDPRFQGLPFDGRTGDHARHPNPCVSGAWARL